MRRDLLTGFLSVIVLTILLGLAYPLLVTGIGQGIFPGKANGSLIKRNGVVVGSALIGQQFYENVIGKNGKVEMKAGAPVTAPDPRYFQTRPSATSDNGAYSSFSNLGPNNIATKDEIVADIQGYLALNIRPDKTPYDPAVTSAAQVPVDAANSSASSVVYRETSASTVLNETWRTAATR